MRGKSRMEKTAREESGGDKRSMRRTRSTSCARRTDEGRWRRVRVAENQKRIHVDPEKEIVSTEGTGSTKRGSKTQLAKESRRESRREKEIDRSRDARAARAAL